MTALWAFLQHKKKRMLKHKIWCKILHSNMCCFIANDSFVCILTVLVITRSSFKHISAKTFACPFSFNVPWLPRQKPPERPGPRSVSFHWNVNVFTTIIDELYILQLFWVLVPHWKIVTCVKNIISCKIIGWKNQFIF